MLLSLFGLFLVTPDGATLIFLIVGYILIQIQVRLEEEFLEKQHGEKYLKYKETAKRFL
jgi:protein-S-isoprenylcysteine O-methyltransferase Ste14